MTKEQRLIKELTAQVKDLTEKVKDAEYWKKYYQDQSSAKEKELNDVHTTLDSMGVPAKSKGPYDSRLSISNRITLLMVMIGLKGTINVTNTMLGE